jgi:chromosome segregation protein
MKTHITRLTLQGFKSFNRKISIPFFPGLIEITGPNGSGKCVDGDTLVQLADGSLKPIRDLVNSALRKSKNVEKLDDGILTGENPENIYVLSLNPLTLKIEKRKVSAFIKRKAPRYLLKIKTRTGKEIIATEYHPFFTLADGILISTNAEKLKVGTKIATPRILRIDDTKTDINILEKLEVEDNIYVPYSKEIVKIVKKAISIYGGKKSLIQNTGIPESAIKGLMDGQSMNLAYLLKILPLWEYTNEIKWLKSKTSNKKLNIVWSVNEDLARFLGYIIAESCSLSSSNQIRFVNGDNRILNDFIRITKRLWGLPVYIGNYKDNCLDAIIYSAPLQGILHKVFSIKIGSSANDKEVPEQIFRSNENVIKHFIAALIDGDGYIHVENKGNKHYCYLEYDTASSRLAFGVATLFLRLGIVPIIRKKKVYIKSKKKRKVYYSIMIYGHRNLKYLSDELPLRSKNKIDALKRIKKWNIESSTSIDVIPSLNHIIKEIVKKAKINIKKIKKTCPKLQAYYENRCECTRDGLIEVLNVLSKYVDKKELEPLYMLANSDIFWDEIVSIEKIKPKEEWVYDLSIDETHNFIANNFIVHNSNIIDAISFVLGRTSAKSLRADRLHELIFRGTETKKPAEYASVTLYLDNSQKTFPFEDKEISITRKVNKKGYVVYKLNGKTTTREKILEVLSLANIRPDGYNIIQQGDVTRVLEMNPVERREIIDEICGIAEYNEKKEKALKDLETVDQKLREVEIIVAQKYEIFKKLEEERNNAIRYQELQKQLTILQASYWKKKVEGLNEKLSKILENISKIKEKIDEVDKEIKEKEQKLEEIEKTNAEIVKKIIELSKKFKVEEEASKIRSRLMIVRDKIETNKREAERLQNLIDEIEKLEIKKAEFSKEMSRAVREILNLKLRGVYGTIADLISVPEEYKTAIEVVAAQHLYDIVVESEDVAIMCIDFLKRERIGRATFLPLNKIKPQEFKEKELLDREGVIGIASKIINYDRKFMPAIEFVFGNTLIIDSLQTAKEIGIGKVRMVTLDGDLIERSGAITGGYLVKEAKREEKINIEEYRKLRLQLLAETEELKKEEEELERRLRELSTSEESKEMISLEKIRIASEKEVERLRESRRKLQDRRINLEIEMNRLAIEKAKIETELENARMEYEKFSSIETIDESLNVLEEKLKKVDGELKKIGTVNLKAIEEYEFMKKEFDALKEKYEKILEEKKAVLKMIEEIDNKRREVFFSTLEKVSKEFNNVCNRMMEGEGVLMLEDVNNLESGLLIKVKLPDKGEVDIDALSGGERSLVALAFLFALQRFKPSPFYLMDEIDAALDKENSLKVARWLKEASKESQFVIVTHNDITLKFADKIYGCTLEEGETKILSIELPEK